MNLLPVNERVFSVRKNAVYFLMNLLKVNTCASVCN